LRRRILAHTPADRRRRSPIPSPPNTIASGMQRAPPPTTELARATAEWFRDEHNMPPSGERGPWIQRLRATPVSRDMYRRKGARHHRPRAV
jgi:hypothetical protein